MTTIEPNLAEVPAAERPWWCEWPVQSTHGARSCGRPGHSTGTGYLSLCWQHHRSFVGTVIDWLIRSSDDRGAPILSVEEIADALIHRGTTEPRIQRLLAEKFAPTGTAATERALRDVWGDGS